MRHPKNPFSPDQPADGAETADDTPYPWLRDRYKVSAEGMPGGPGPAGGHGGGPPPLPRRTGDSGFRPYRTQAAAQDFWPLADPEDSWPLAPRPQAGPQDSRPAQASPEPQEPWAESGPQEPWTQNGPGKPWTQNGPGEPWTQNGPGEPWAEEGPQEPWAEDGLQEPPAQARPAEPWAQDGPAEPPAQAPPAEPWAQNGQAEPWAQNGPAEPWARDGRAEPWAQNGPDGPWTPAGAPHSWSPAPPPDSGSRDYWDDADLQEPWPSGSPEAGPPQPGPPQPDPPQPDPRETGPRETGPGEPWLQAPGPAADAPRMPGPHDVPEWQEPPSPARNAGPPDLDEPWLRTAKPKSPRWRRGRGGHSAPEPAYQDDLPPADGTHLFPAQAGSAGLDAGPAPSMESQDLWESWEPPYNQAGAAPEPVLNRTAPYPELVRDAEYEDELWQTPGLGGAGGDGPRYPGQHRRSAHARNAGRPRMSGAFLALAGALAVAGAIPLGILGVRTLHHADAALKTAPLSASHVAASAPGPNGAATFTALAGPGCPAATGASVFPYHPANGDDWFPGTASASGPCGRLFSYVYLAMVPGNPGEWRDHYAWIFHTGMDNPSCTFSLYIPAAPQANSTVYYWFSAGDSNAADRIADFTIDQATHQGQWVTKGPFTFPGGTVLIEATDRGEGSVASAVAAGPARLSC